MNYTVQFISEPARSVKNKPQAIGGVLLAAAAVILGLLAPGPARAGERLLVPRLHGWVLADSHHGPTIEVDDLFPRGQNIHKWTQRLSIDAFRRTPMTVQQFLVGVVAQTGAACKNVAASPITLSLLDGVPAGRRTVACGRYAGDGKGEFTLYYAIRGSAALYVLARAWHGAAFTPGQTAPIPAAELARWNAAFDTVRLCGADGSASDCPAALPPDTRFTP